MNNQKPLTMQQLDDLYAESKKSVAAHYKTITISIVLWLIEVVAFYFEDFDTILALFVVHIPLLLYMFVESNKNTKLVNAYVAEVDKYLAKQKEDRKT